MLLNERTTNFARVQVGDRVQICFGFATLDHGAAEVTKVGRVNFTVLAEGESGLWRFRKADGRAAAGQNQRSWCLPRQQAEAILTSGRCSPAQRPPIIVNGKPHPTLVEGQGEL